MARRRNEETIAAVQAAACEIILEQGYEAASYTAIAERTGIPRTTVQHYFPSKETFATTLMTRFERTAQERARKMTPDGEPMIVSYYLAAQIVYGMFYLTEGTRKFLLDMSTSRDLQHSAAPDYIAEALEVFGLDDVDERDLADLQYENGGVYEIHYIFLKNGKTPDFAKLVRGFMHVLARLLGITEEEFARLIDRYTLSNEKVLEIGAELMKEI